MRLPQPISLRLKMQSPSTGRILLVCGSLHNNCLAAVEIETHHLVNEYEPESNGQMATQADSGVALTDANTQTHTHTQLHI